MPVNTVWWSSALWFVIKFWYSAFTSCSRSLHHFLFVDIQLSFSVGVRILNTATARKVSKYGGIRTEYEEIHRISTSYLFVFSPNTGIYGPEITPYLDTSSSEQQVVSEILSLKITKTFSKNSHYQIITFQHEVRISPSSFASWFTSLFLFLHTADI